MSAGIATRIKVAAAPEKRDVETPVFANDLIPADSLLLTLSMTTPNLLTFCRPYWYYERYVVLNITL